mgnify:CR=1 FL=1
MTFFESHFWQDKFINHLKVLLVMTNIKCSTCKKSITNIAGSTTAAASSTTPITIGFETVIIANGEIGIDHAIASSISHDMGIPVIYVENGDVKAAVEQLKSGIYQDVKEVVILGGETVISS